jgi:prepilin-type N-terminal cleavage/methylation domain-containing protein
MKERKGSAEIRLSGENGFSLIEVMVAVMILTVGLLSLAQMMVLATNSNSLSGRMTSASALAREQMERLKATPFYSDPITKTRNPALEDGGDLDAPGGGGYAQLYDAQGNPVGGAGQYEVRWEIETLPTALPLEMVEIRVRCVSVNTDQFNFIGEARFTTFRTANVG